MPTSELRDGKWGPATPVPFYGPKYYLSKLVPRGIREIPARIQERRRWPNGHPDFGKPIAWWQVWK